jgi:small redox-active disulfide protein 2
MIKNVQVIGSGCPTCKELFNRTREALLELKWQEGEDFTLEYVSDVMALIELNVMSSPALVIDGNPVLVGSIKGVEELKQILSDK